MNTEENDRGCLKSGRCRDDHEEESGVPSSALSEYERERYSRQLLYPGFTEVAQRRLARARVFIAGAGGLGSPAALYLAAAGVGFLTICDPDTVSLSNLNRQILHAEERLGKNKAESAAATLRAFSSRCAVTPLAVRIEADNAKDLIRGHDLIIDCLDSFSARMVLAAAAFAERIPYLHAGVSGMGGQAGLFDPPRTACLCCVIGGAVDSGAREPIIGAAAGMLGSIEALEAVRFLSGLGSPLYGKLLVMDAGSYGCHLLDISADPDCPVCASRRRCGEPDSGAGLTRVD